MFHTWTHDLTTGALPEQNGILLIFFSSRRVNWMTWTGRHGMSKFKIYGFHGHRLLVRSPRVQSIDSTSPATVREWKSWIADVATNNTHADGWLSKLISRWVSDWWTVSSWLGWFIAFQSNFDVGEIWRHELRSTGFHSNGIQLSSRVNRWQMCHSCRWSTCHHLYKWNFDPLTLVTFSALKSPNHVAGGCHL